MRECQIPSEHTCPMGQVCSEGSPQNISKVRKQREYPEVRRYDIGSVPALFCLCSTTSVDPKERQGSYSKRRDRITSPVTRVSPSAPEPARSNPPSQESSGGGVFINRTASTLIASLLTFLLLGIVYIGSAVLTREHHLDHVKAQQKQMRIELDEIELETQELERRIVELATEIENMKDDDGEQ